MVFFIKQKTAYEMRISDWSSDVCSSDLPLVAELRHHADAARRHILRRRIEQCSMVGERDVVEVVVRIVCVERTPAAILALHADDPFGGAFQVLRSEERRVGQECVSTCSLRWAPNHNKKKK